MNAASGAAYTPDAYAPAEQHDPSGRPGDFTCVTCGQDWPCDYATPEYTDEPDATGESAP